MSAEPAASEGSYVRGTGGVDIDARKLVRIFLVLCILALAGIAIATAVQAAGQDSRQSELRHHGVRVPVSVTGCIAVGSGVGQGVSYYTCRGDFVLNGTSHNEVIGGTRIAYTVGSVIQGVAVPGHPEILATAASVAKKTSGFSPYVTPVILGILSLLLITGLLVWPARKVATVDSLR